MARLGNFLGQAGREFRRQVFGDPNLSENRVSDLSRSKALSMLEAAENQVTARMLEDVWSSTGVQDDDERKWSLMDLSGSVDGTVKPSDTDWNSIRNQCRNLGLNNPHAVGIIGTYQDYCVGDGLQVRPLIEDPVVRKAVADWWAETEIELDLVERELEAVRRIIRDGELFQRFGDPTDEMDNAPFSLRWVEPSKVNDTRTDVTNKVTHGIETEPGDVERVVNYILGAAVVPADEMLHLKVGTDANVKRGLPLLYCVKDVLHRYDRWLYDRIILNRIRSAIVLIRKHGGTGVSPSAVSTLVSAARTRSRSTTQADGTQRAEHFQKWRPGTILDVPATTQYEFLAPKVQAADVRFDGRAILHSAAVGARIPYFMLSGDVSDVSFASVLISEAPGVKRLMAFRGFIARGYVRPIYRRALRERAGTDGIPADVSLTCKIVGERITTRDRSKDVLADEKMHLSGALSLQTWRERDGLDHEVEEERVRQEEMEHGPQVRQPTDRRGPGDKPDDERDVGGRVRPRPSDRTPDNEVPKP